MAPKNTFLNALVPRCSQNTRNPLSPALGGPLSRENLYPRALPNTLEEILSVVGGARSKVYASKKKQKLPVIYILPFKETKEFCG
jgi:hypothetical protein